MVEKLTLPVNGTHVVPLITDPMGKHWQQPNPANLIFVGEFVYMTREDFNKLLEYSSSQPSGTYEGKMWKAKRNVPAGAVITGLLPGDCVRAVRRIDHKPKWKLLFRRPRKYVYELCWFGRHPTNPEKYLTNNYRRIAIIKKKVVA